MVNDCKEGGEVLTWWMCAILHNRACTSTPTARDSALGTAGPLLYLGKTVKLVEWWSGASLFQHSMMQRSREVYVYSPNNPESIKPDRISHLKPIHSRNYNWLNIIVEATCRYSRALRKKQGRPPSTHITSFLRPISSHAPLLVSISRYQARPIL